MSDQVTTQDEDPEVTDTTSADAEAADDVSTFDAEKALAKIRKQNAENASLRAAKKVAEEKATANEAAASEAVTLRRKLMRAEVALELGLPANVAKRMQGDTVEELKADAEELLALIAPKPAPTPKPTRPVESLQPGSGKAEDEPDLDALIAAAQKAGDYRTVISLQNRKLAPT